MEGTRWVRADAAAVFAAALLFGLDSTLLAAVAARAEVVSLRGGVLVAMLGTFKKCELDGGGIGQAPAPWISTTRCGADSTDLKVIRGKTDRPKPARLTIRTPDPNVR